MSSRLASRPRSAKTSRAASMSSARLRAASLRSGREAGRSAGAVMTNLPSVRFGSEYDTAGRLRVRLGNARPEDERGERSTDQEDGRGPPERRGVAMDRGVDL